MRRSWRNSARSEEADADDDATDHNDYDFVPDIAVRDGATIATPAGTFECLHTPGHISNHLCFAWNETKALFTGDHVMGWSTTVIPAPDGDMAAYLDNLERLLDRDDEVYWPTHGPPVTETKPFVEALLHHRRSREQQILELLDRGEATVAELVAVMYADVDEKLHKPAAGSVTSHLTALVRTGRVSRSGDRYALVS